MGKSQALSTKVKFRKKKVGASSQVATLLGRSFRCKFRNPEDMLMKPIINTIAMIMLYFLFGDLGYD